MKRRRTFSHCTRLKKETPKQTNSSIHRRGCLHETEAVNKGFSSEEQQIYFSLGFPSTLRHIQEQSGSTRWLRLPSNQGSDYNRQIKEELLKWTVIVTQTEEEYRRASPAQVEAPPHRPRLSSSSHMIYAK